MASGGAVGEVVSFTGDQEWSQRRRGFRSNAAELSVALKVEAGIGSDWDQAH
jgi:DNA polymerase I-like protein with 3'-5' exonuclease and polymerase domains